jgi:hypothetical protein
MPALTASTVGPMGKGKRKSRSSHASRASRVAAEAYAECSAEALGEDAGSPVADLAGESAPSATSKGRRVPADASTTLYDALSQRHWAVDSSDDWVVIVEVEDTRLRTFNPAFAAFWAPRVEGVLSPGHEIGDVLPPEAAATWCDLVARTVADGPLVAEWTVGEDGPVVELRTRYFPAGGCVGVVGRDVSAPRRGENELVDALNETVAELRNQVRRSERSLRALKKELAEREPTDAAPAEVARLESLLADRDNDVKRLAAELSARQGASVATKEIARLEGLLAERGSDAARLAQELATAQATLAERQRAFDEAAEELSTTRAAMAQHESNLASLRSVTAERERDLATLRSAMAEREGDLETLRETVAQREAELVAATAELAARGTRDEAERRDAREEVASLRHAVEEREEQAAGGASRTFAAPRRAPRAR